MTSVQAMRDLLEATAEELQRLRVLLSDEAERLKARNIDGLDRLLGDKLASLQVIERQDTERRRLLVAAGEADDPEGMRRYLAAAPDLSASWEALKSELRAVQELNEANGTLIQRGMGDLQRRIGLLHGESAAGSANTYNPRGQTTPRPGGREISRA